MNIFCSKCANPLASDAKFCSRCAAPVVTDPAVRPPPLAQLPQSVMVARPKSWTGRHKGIVVFTVIVIACVAVILAVGEMVKRELDEEEQPKRLAEGIFKSMTPLEHLGKAASALMPGSSLDLIDEGLRNLNAVPQSSPEASQVNAIARKLISARNLAAKHEQEIAENERLARLSPLELASEQTERASKQTKILKFSWSKEGFGNVMMANFTVRNNSPYDIKDLEIQCEHSAPSGTVIDSNTRTIYEIVKANSTRTFQGVSMGFIASQVAESGCHIVSLNLASNR
jgi:hypothetical protein